METILSPAFENVLLKVQVDRIVIKLLKSSGNNTTGNRIEGYTENERY